MMLRPTKVFVGLGILALALVLVGIELLVRPGVKSSPSQPTSYQECVDGGGAILESYPTQCALNGQTFTNPDQKAEEPAQPQADNPQPALKTYEDPKYGFKFQYDSSIFTEAQVQEKFPWKNKSVSSFQIAHTVPVEHCALSGRPEDCTPTSTDISVTFVPVEASLNEILAVSQNLFGPMEKWDFHGIPATVGSLGAEGEGKQYVFISLSPNRTLMIVRTHIDEQIQSKYQNVEGFFGRDKQEMIFDELMKTFELTK